MGSDKKVTEIGTLDWGSLACSRFYSVLGTVPAISLERINLGTKFGMQMKYDEYQLKDGKQF